ncbi:NitT/TauT family transport system ATP-binding protein [Granulicella pectinivorans]|jgi:NitT/TauT family transport system ATP-binding protein|uniref:NitT/TauT family transport system ATP-binding protein n=1 Tax=Granulicella pectinivorans TaxID=474950 RepID=A0A1I6L7D6_9BACT|nr:ABC transporter ATP-binding protein [Granulicella pectinivorans]SFR99395.1 NitT/TauT family transport system ATP-binding protein [Granulicella pectinivorans]
MPEARVPAVAFDHVTKRFGTAKPILESLSVSIQPGEFVSIVGPSGCGKSTLLRLVSGLSPTTSGTVEVEGMTPKSAREITSFIFQDPTLLPWRTVRRNVALGLELEHTARERRDEIVSNLLTLVGLDHVADSYPRQLSGGMKMRASIARALASNPRILLLDEPFAALDEITRDRMNEELIRLYQQQSWTVLFVTHSVAEAVFLSTRILVLAPHPGRLAHDIPIDLPYPRTAETRASESFDQLVAHVSRTLREVHTV